MKKVFMTVFVLALIVSVAYGVTVYKWVDKEGVVHFTDDYTNIPAQYRNQVKTEETEESQRRETSTSPSAQKSEEVTVDRDGQREDYWRSRVLPWRKQLQEATENYESINKKLTASIEEQSGKLLTSAQLTEKQQWIEERSKYEAEIKEANDMLGKIAKEAEEAKANPAWLK